MLLNELAILRGKLVNAEHINEKLKAELEKLKEELYFRIPVKIGEYL